MIQSFGFTKVSCHLKENFVRFFMLALDFASELFRNFLNVEDFADLAILVVNESLSTEWCFSRSCWLMNEIGLIYECFKGLQLSH